MSTVKIAGVMRAGAYSPNHIGNDATIFNLTADELRKRGCQVNCYTEEQFNAGAVTEDIIVNMCREPRSIRLLQKYEDRGVLVINSGYGIENCIRERTTRILLGSGIPHPASVIVNTDEVVTELLERAGIDRAWIKRGDSHSMHREDVSFVRHRQEAQEVLQEYFLRGIKKAVINIHLEGDLVKFYGVAGTSFFHWFFPTRQHHSKFGDEAINGDVHGYNFDSEALKALSQKCADLLDVTIYGGDCIVAPDGSMQVIDFNDWPSFAPCRQEAAPYIAKAIMAAVRKYQEKK